MKNIHTTDTFSAPSFYREIAGNQIAFYEKGKGSKIILFIHGNSGSAKYFELLFKSSLADTYRLVTFDFAGCGKSPKAIIPENGYGIRGGAKTLQEIARSIGEPAIWVAHSLGANAALYAAAQDISSIKGLFLSGACIINNLSDELDQALQPNPAIASFLKEEHTEEERKLMFEAEVFKPTDEMYALFRKIIIDSVPEVRMAIVQEIQDAAFKLNHKQFVSECPAPIAIVEGKEDEIIQFRSFTNLPFRHLWRNTLFQVPESGHCVHIEKPAEMIELIDAFAAEFSGF